MTLTREEQLKLKPYFRWYEFSACGNHYHDRPMNEEEKESLEFYKELLAKEKNEN